MHVPCRLQVRIYVQQRPAPRPPLQQLPPLLLVHLPPLLAVPKALQPHAKCVRLLHRQDGGANLLHHDLRLRR